MTTALDVLEARVAAIETTLGIGVPTGGAGVDGFVRQLLCQVANASLQRPEAIVGEGRGLSLVHARWAVIWVARELRQESFARIGRVLGGRDHTTIHYGYGRARALRDTNADFRALTDTVAAASRGRA